MSSRPKPVTFSEFLLLIRSKYSTLPTTVLKQKPVLASVTAFSWFSSLPSNAHVLLDSIFDSCLIPSLNHRFEPPAQCWRFPNPYFQSSHLSWASDPVAICLLSIPTWMSQPSPSPKTCSSSYILYSRWSWLTSCSTVLYLPFMHQHRCFTGLEGLPFSSKLASLPLTWDPSPPR